MNRLALFLIIIALPLASCAHVLQRETVTEAVSTKGIPFEAVASEPKDFIGKTFIWGGFIVETKNTAEGTFVEIVQNPVDNYGYITDPDASAGRFIAFTKKHLDPLIFEKGREITVAGKLIEARKQALGDIEYIYPLIEIKDYHLWKGEDYYIYPSEPYYYPYAYDPYMLPDPWYWGWGYSPYPSYPSYWW